MRNKTQSQAWILVSVVLFLSYLLCSPAQGEVQVSGTEKASLQLATLILAGKTTVKYVISCVKADRYGSDDLSVITSVRALGKTIIVEFKSTDGYTVETSKINCSNLNT